MDDLNAQARQYLKIKAERDELKAHASELQKQLDDLEHKIIENLETNGLDRATVEGFNFKPQRKLSVSTGGSTNKLALAFQEMGMTEFLTVHNGTLTSYIKEQLTNEMTNDWELEPQRLSPTIRPLVKLSEYHKLSVTKA